MSTAYKKMTSHGSISIPVAMRRELGIEPKDPMIVEEHQGEIRIKPYTLRCNFCGTTEDVHTREFRVIWHEEHNLIFLDGTWSLDGSKIIDAWQKTEVL